MDFLTILTPFNILAVIGGLAGILFFARQSIVMGKMFVMLDSLLPVVFDLAKQFKNDSGSSALDIIQHLQTAAKESVVAAETARLLAAESQHTQDALQRAIERIGDQQRQLEQIVNYAAQRIQINTNNAASMPTHVGGDVNRSDIGANAQVGQAALGREHMQVEPVKVIVVPDVPVPVQVVPPTEPIASGK